MRFLASSPPRPAAGEWRLDVNALQGAVTERSRAVFINNASFPSGWVANDSELEAVASVSRERDLWLLYWGGFEGVLYDGRRVRHPASLSGMRDRTVTVGAPSFEQRMIAWRVGWVVAPGELVKDVSRVHIYNGLVPSGFAQVGTRVALGLPDEDLAAANAEWQRRRDETLRQLDGLPVVRAAGGWSLLLDVSSLGLDCADVSLRLLEQKVAATPMRGWGGRDRRSLRPLRVQQRARREAGDARRPGPRGCRGHRCLRSRHSPVGPYARWLRHLEAKPRYREGVAETYEFGPADGRLTIRAFRDGVAASMGHDLVIEVMRWTASATVDGSEPSSSSLTVTADLRSLQVREGTGGANPLTDKDRRDIKENMDKVLQVDRFPEVSFRSRRVGPPSGERCAVEGELELAGNRRSLSFDVTGLAEREFRAHCTLVQSQWGIKPHRAFMGALKVKDALEVDCEVRPAQG